MARFTKIIVSALGVALALAGCTSTSNNNNSPSSSGSPTASYTGPDLNLIKAGTLTICSDVPYKPFEYQEAGTPTGFAGFDIDLMTEIANNLGLKLVVLPTDFDALQSGVALAAKQCDLAASAVTITEARKANIDFSDPYYDSLQSLLVLADSGINSLEDMAGKTIGVQTQTTGENYTRAHAPADAKIVSFPTDGEMWLALQAGTVQALLQDFPINNQHVKDDSRYKIVAEYPTDEQYGFAFSKGGNPALLAEVNKQLKTMRENGMYDTLFKKYFSLS